MSAEKFSQAASKESLEKAVAALKANGIDAQIVEKGTDAKAKVLELIPGGAEVMTMTSVTLDTLSISAELNDSGRYQSVRNLYLMGEGKDPGEARRRGAAPEWVVGSAHAVTEDGKIIIASNTGSQLPAYAYGAAHVVWVVGAQKVVQDQEEAIKRVYEYTLLLESERAKNAYGVPGSFVSKLLIVHKEVQPGRIHLIIVNEAVGY